MQDQQESYAPDWPRVYAQGTAILMENHLVFGAESMFQTAVTHGLLAVVAQEWPGDHLRADSKTKSANALIEWLKGRSPANGVVYTIRDTQGVNSPERPGCVEVKLETLAEGVEFSDAHRHGRGGDSLERCHIDALERLDEHSALGGLEDIRRDRDWVRARVLDSDRLGHAQDYLDFIGKEEAERRAQLADDYLPFDLKDRAISLPLEECPSCSYTALVPLGEDPFGNGVGVGHCVVCGYYRSLDRAEDEAFDIEWRAHWADD